LGKRIIFDVGHPAQVHNFKHVYWELNKKGWTGLFTAKDKEVTISLLKNYNLPYVLIGKSGSNLFSKTFGLVSNLIRFLKVLLSFRPEIVVCRFSPHATWCSKLLGISVIGLADTEHTKILDSLTVPFDDAKLTAYSYEKELGENHIRFHGNIELFYLHPNRYKIPENIFDILNSGVGQGYALLRFVAWNAHHDIGESGFTIDDKKKLIRTIEDKYKVYISSENELPSELLKYKIDISPEKMHDVLAHASVYVGEGASMASEAACLGVPSVYVNSLNVGYIKEVEKYGLVINLRNAEDLPRVLERLINDSITKDKVKDKLRSFLKDKIDVSAFLVWFIEYFPESIRIMKENPEFQERFK